MESNKTRQPYWLKDHPKSAQPEDQLQEATATWLKLCKPYLLAWHTPNGGARTGKAGAKMKRHGAMAGAPDWLIFTEAKDLPGTPNYWKFHDTVEPKDTAGFHGLAIELKTRNNRLQKTQIEVLDRLKAEGWATAVAYSLDEFIDIVCYYEIYTQYRNI